ncbi:WSC domain-containing protein [Lactarius indigo]|nr:WSC domain-containing protein [Lactarius indigo]
MRMIYPIPRLTQATGFQLAVLLAIVPLISAEYTLLGCVTNGFLGSAMYKDPTDMSVFGCVSFCFNRAHPYAGVENGENCYCGDSWPETSKTVSSDKCNVKCTGDSRENCGGSGYVDLYLSIILLEENRSLDEERKDT